MSDNYLTPVKFTTLKKMVNQLEKKYTPEQLEELELGFEFLIGSLFPLVYNNMQEALNKEHTLGYIEGLQEGRNENQRIG